jgi:hypothetical protein
MIKLSVNNVQINGFCNGSRLIDLGEVELYYGSNNISIQGDSGLLIKRLIFEENDNNINITPIINYTKIKNTEYHVNITSEGPSY